MDLRANAIITAIDRFSGPVTRMAGALRGLTGTAAGAVAGAKKVGRSLSNFGSGAGVPTSLVGALALRGEYDVDRLSRQMQAVGEISDQQRKMLVDNAFKTSVQVGEGADDLIKAQKELIQGGLDPDTIVGTTKLIAKAAKTNAMELSTVAEDAINVARGLGFAFDTTEQKTASLTRALNFMSVVPALSTETWEGLRESLKYSAPVASMLGIEIEELGAALSVLADRGFKGEEGGTAFRTILLRGIGPTKKLTDAYRAAGIQIEDLYDLDSSMIDDGNRLKERLLAAGWGGQEKEIDAALKRVGGREKYDGLYAYQDALQAELSDRLDVTDAQDKRTLKKSIDQHIFSSMKNFNLVKFFEALRKLPLSDFKEVAGIQRTSQARALLDDLKRIPDLEEEFRKLIPGSVDRRFEDIDRGFAQSIDKMRERFAYLRHNVFEAGLGKDLEGFFDGIATGLEKFAATNPEALGLIAKGGLMAALAAGIGAIASSPWAVAVAAITAMAAVAGDFDPKKGLIGEKLKALGGSPDSSEADATAPKSWNDHWELFKRQMIELPTWMSQLWFGTENVQGGVDRKVTKLPGEPETDPVARRKGLDFGQRGLIRDIDPTAGPQTIDVTGKVDANVQGTVSGKVDVEVTVKGGGEVTKQSGGDLKGNLNTGKSMPDAGR